MGWSTYVEAIRFHGREWFFLTRVDDDHPRSDDPIVRDSSGSFALYTSESEARDSGRAAGEPLQEHPTVKLDLDGVVAWCADPKAETLDHRLAMLAWHTLIDFGVAEPLPNAIEPHEPDYMLSVVAKKVHDGRAATTNPPTMAVPGWSPPELFLLASTLRAGVDRLGAELKTRDKFSF